MYPIHEVCEKVFLDDNKDDWECLNRDIWVKYMF